MGELLLISNGAVLYRDGRGSGPVYDSDQKKVEFEEVPPDSGRWQVKQILKKPEQGNGEKVAETKRPASLLEVREEKRKELDGHSRKELWHMYKMPKSVRQKKSELIEKILDKEGYKKSGLYKTGEM